MKGTAEVLTAEELYEQLRPRLSASDGWLAREHPELQRRADAMVEALQKKEYVGGVVKRAAQLASHLKATDSVLAMWLERQAALAATKSAAEKAAAEKTAAKKVAEEKAVPEKAAAGGAGVDATAAAAASLGAPGQAAGGGGVEGGASGSSNKGAKQEGEDEEGGARGRRKSSKGGKSGSGGEVKEDDEEGTMGKKQPSKGGATTALEYLTTTFAHLREQRSLVKGDKKDCLLREVAGLRQLRAGHINVLRGARSSETTMGHMLAALKQADQALPPTRAKAPAAAAAAAEASGESTEGAPKGADPMETEGTGADGRAAGECGGEGSGSGSRGGLDNLTCVVWEDWRVPERLGTLLRAGDSVCVYVEVHCRDGPEDTRLAMKLTSFVALALCSQRLIAELYQDMFINPQRVAASRPQRKRQKTAAEETVQTLDESPDSLDFVDFVEALHRRMPLRCGWMYANAIMPTAGEWDRVFGRQAGRLSGLYDGGPELDELGRACLAFHHTRHESPLLDVHVLASRLRQQQQRWQQEGKEHHRHQLPAQYHQADQKQQAVQQGTAQQSRSQPQLLRRPVNGVQVASVESPSQPVVVPLKQEESSDAASAGDIAGSGDVPCGGASGSCCRTGSGKSPSLILHTPGDSSGRDQGLDLGHLSFTCITAAPLADDFLGELIRQTTAGQAAAEVAAAAAAAAAVKAAKCNGKLCGGACTIDAAAAAAAAEAASTKLAIFPLGDPTAVALWEAVDEETAEEEADLFGAVQEELMAVEHAAKEAENAAAAGEGGTPPLPPIPHMKVELSQGGVRLQTEAEETRAAAVAANGPAGRSGPGRQLKGTFSHRMQLLPGVFYSYFIGSQAFTNTAWHVEDFLLQSINLMMVGRPKAWWWVPRAHEEAFKEHLDEHWEKEDIYTKSVPLAGISLDKLIKMGVRRSVQLPGAIFITSPGYAFHTTMSSGWSMADSANFMANILGKDMHVLEDERPLEQYPPAEGRTSTGEWVRFTMRRIEELRAANDPAYVPRPLQRLRKEAAAARRAASVAVATAGGSAAVKIEPAPPPRKDWRQRRREREEEALKAASAATATAAEPAGPTESVAAEPPLAASPAGAARPRAKVIPKTSATEGGTHGSPEPQSQTGKASKRPPQQPQQQPAKKQRQAEPPHSGTQQKQGAGGGALAVAEAPAPGQQPQKRVRDRARERERHRERRRREKEARERALRAQQAAEGSTAAADDATAPLVASAARTEVHRKDRDPGSGLVAAGAPAAAPPPLAKIPPIKLRIRAPMLATALLPVAPPSSDDDSGRSSDAVIVEGPGGEQEAAATQRVAAPAATASIMPAAAAPAPVPTPAVALAPLGGRTSSVSLSVPLTALDIFSGGGDLQLTLVPRRLTPPQEQPASQQQELLPNHAPHHQQHHTQPQPQAEQSQALQQHPELLLKLQLMQRLVQRGSGRGRSRSLGPLEGDLMAGLRASAPGAGKSGVSGGVGGGGSSDSGADGRSRDNSGTPEPAAAAVAAATEGTAGGGTQGGTAAVAAAALQRPQQQQQQHQQQRGSGPVGGRDLCSAAWAAHQRQQHQHQQSQPHPHDYEPHPQQSSQLLQRDGHQQQYQQPQQAAPEDQRDTLHERQMQIMLLVQAQRQKQQQQQQLQHQQPVQIQPSQPSQQQQLQLQQQQQQVARAFERLQRLQQELVCEGLGPQPEGQFARLQDSEPWEQAPPPHRQDQHQHRHHEQQPVDQPPPPQQQQQQLFLCSQPRGEVAPEVTLSRHPHPHAPQRNPGYEVELTHDALNPDQLPPYPPRQQQQGHHLHQHHHHYMQQHPYRHHIQPPQQQQPEVVQRLHNPSLSQQHQQQYQLPAQPQLYRLPSQLQPQQPPPVSLQLERHQPPHFSQQQNSQAAPLVL